MNTFYRNVFAVADSYHPRAPHFQIGAVRIFLPAGPEGIPERGAAAVQRAFSAYGEPVAAIGIDKGGHIGLEYAFDMHRDVRKVVNIRTALKHSAFFQQKMGARFEKQSPR